MILAPLRGVTIRCFREVFADVIRDAGFAEAITPFIAALPGSRRYAERDFLKATGKSILQAIIDVRLEKVKELLQNPKCRLSAIASQCGWTSANYLRRAFQERMHMSMSDWRKQNVRG